MTHEELTRDKPWSRTKDDYLKILLEGQTETFGDYDNSEAFFSLIKDGLAEIDQSKGPSVWTSMNQSVWLKLTEAGISTAQEAR